MALIQSLNQGSEPESRVSTRFNDLMELGKRAGYLSLPKNNIKSQHKGSLLSSFKGRGMELADIRRYEDGDDVRDINWQTFARTGDLYTKLYQEERERPLYLWVDHGKSMQFATQGCYKAVIASYLASLVGWHELGNHNRIGGFVADDVHTAHIKPSKSRQGFMAFLNQLCQSPVDSQSQTQSLSQRLSHLASVKQPGSALYLFSDFRGWDQQCEDLLLRLSRHQDIMLTLVLDPLEVALPPKGRYRFSNGVQQMSLNMSSDTRPYYQQMKQRIDGIAAMSRYANIDCAAVFTNEDPIESSYQSLNQIQNKLLGGAFHEL